MSTEIGQIKEQIENLNMKEWNGFSEEQSQFYEKVKAILSTSCNSLGSPIDGYASAILNIKSSNYLSAAQKEMTIQAVNRITEKLLNIDLTNENPKSLDIQLREIAYKGKMNVHILDTKGIVLGNDILLNLGEEKAVIRKVENVEGWFFHENYLYPIDYILFLLGLSMREHYSITFESFVSFLRIYFNERSFDEWIKDHFFQPVHCVDKQYEYRDIKKNVTK